jgi:hypothetical protein
MASGTCMRNEKTIEYRYKIKDAPRQDIHITNQNITVYAIDKLINDDYNYQPGQWEEVLDDAEENLKHLKFGPEVKTGLKQYVNKINEEYRKSSTSDDHKNKIDKWRKEGPDSLFENLKALNGFVSTTNLYQDQAVNNGHYYFNNHCDFYEACSSNIRFFGVDCVNESRGIIEDGFAEADRKKRNSEGSYSTYWTHIRPKTMPCDDSLWFLTLRIHFRLLEPYTARNI